MAIVWVAGQRLGMKDELSALGPLVGGGKRDFDTELVGHSGFALADALGFSGMPGIQFPAALTLLLAADLARLSQGVGEELLACFVAIDLAADIPDQAAQAGAQELQPPVVALELFGMGKRPASPTYYEIDVRVMLSPERGAMAIARRSW